MPFPRILGIEAAGIVEEAPGGEFKKGDVVATAMGGMGRQFDGGYAQYTSVPAAHVQVGPVCCGRVAVTCDLAGAVEPAVTSMCTCCAGVCTVKITQVCITAT